MNINENRVSASISPGYSSVVDYLSEQIKTITNGVTDEDKLKYLYQKYGGFKPEELWVEHVKYDKVLSDGSILTCFTVKANGFGFIDAKLKPSTYQQLVKDLSIPITVFKSNEEFIALNKTQFIDTLISLPNNSQYGIVIDREMSIEEIKIRIKKATGNLDFFSTVIHYENNVASKSKLTTGQITVNHPLISPYSFLLLDRVEIKKL